MRVPTALLLVALASRLFAQDLTGVLPAGADGKPLNLDFETGDLRDWTAAGESFDKQPIKGDVVSKRRADMKSQHQGQYWLGGFEVAGDKPKGTLTSATFKVMHPWASFLVGGGPNPETRIELVRADDKTVFFKTSGVESENLARVVVDLKKHLNHDIFIRIVDDHTGHWGHINFDDFRFHAQQPKFPKAALVNTKPAVVPPPMDLVKNAGLAPDAAAKEITLPPGFSATLFAGEPDITQPVAMCIDDRGRLWVVEAHTYPKKAPEGQGKDRVLIFEDTNNDGKADKTTVFMEGLNLVSGIEVGFGGVWIGAAPQLLFIADKDGDDKPDGAPQVLLDGWGYQDTHETLNAFIWGPDGWLYGCHGVFTHSKVGKPGATDAERTPINAGVWRYHPTKHVFEVFAHGTSNPWGVDFNDHGQAFITACVIPHLYHIIQGARYERQGGKHFNPYTFNDIKTIADHRHWAGAGGPHAGNNRSDAAGGGHAHCGAMVYLGDTWPAQYRNTIFMANIHGNRINNDILEAKGSGYVGKHGKDLLLMNDKWSRLINFKYGPDGNVYMIDWYDAQACHLNQPEKFDRKNGRVYKISYSPAKAHADREGGPVRLGDEFAALADVSPGRITPAVPKVLPLATDVELVALHQHPNDFHVRHARRILQQRQSKDAIEPLKKLLGDNFEPTVLRAMWTLHTLGAIDEATALGQMKHADPYVRGWAIQLALEDSKPSDAILTELARLAKDDPSPIVRLYIASALQRIEPAKRWEILKPLIAHAEDAADHNLPLMYWYALEPLVTVDKAKALATAATGKIPLLREYVTRRLASN